MRLAIQPGRTLKDIPTIQVMRLETRFMCLCREISNFKSMRRKTETEEGSFLEKQSWCPGGEAQKKMMLEKTQRRGRIEERQSQKAFIKLAHKVKCDNQPCFVVWEGGFFRNCLKKARTETKQSSITISL